MARFLFSLLLGLGLGVAIGVTLGWGVFPTQSVDNPASQLAQVHQDAYTVMIAAGYRADGDMDGVYERLRVLGLSDTEIPAHVAAVAERYIDQSRPVDDIYHLVALAEAMNVLTDDMRPYRDPNVQTTAP